MCLVGFIVKYVLCIINVIFSILGIVILGLGIALLVALSDLNHLLPVNVFPISIMVIGIIIFLISSLACCGAVRESKCMLISYAIAVAVLVAIKVWMAVVVFSVLDDIQVTVDGWVESAFGNDDLRPAFHFMEASFQCCGTSGPASYTPEALPLTCCPLPEGITIPDLESLNPDNFNITDINDLASLYPGLNTTDITPCTAEEAYNGCGVMVGTWIENIGGIFGTILLIVISVEVGAIIFALFFFSTITNKKQTIY